MRDTQTHRGGSRIWLAALLFLILLVLVILLALRGCAPRGIYEGKIQSPINDARPLEPACVLELLAVDGNGDGVPDYQQVNEIEPRTDYDRDVLAALSWLNGHLNELDENGNVREPNPGREAPAVTLPPFLEHDGLSGAGSSSQEPEKEPASSAPASSLPASSAPAAPESSEAGGPESSEPDFWWSPAQNTPAALTVTGIRVKTPPAKAEYIEGESFDPAGLEIVMALSNGTEKPVTAFQYPTEPLVLGMTAIPVSMPTGAKVFTAEIPITVREKKLLDIHAAPPEKEYIEGQLPAPGDFTVFGDYDNGTTGPIPDAVIQVPEKPLVPGQMEIEITVTVGDRTETVTVPVTVRRKRPVELIVTHGPEKADYIAGEVFEPEGIAVAVRYDNGERADIDDFTISPGELAEGQAFTEIAYTENGTTVTALIRVTVCPESLIEASIHSMPDKTDYPEGVPFIPDGLVLDCKYDNGKAELRTDYTFSSAALRLGATEFPVAITHRDITLTVDVPITVRPTVPDSISLLSYPEDMVQEAGTKLDLSGMELEISYDNGTSIIVPATDSRVELSNGKRHYDRIDPVAGFSEYLLADCIFTDNGVTVRGTEGPGSSRLKITPYLAHLSLRLSDEVPYYKVGHSIGPTGLVAEFQYPGETVETAPCDLDNPADEIIQLISSGLARLEYEETTASNDGAGDKPVTIKLIPNPKFLNTEESAVQVQVAPLLPDKLEVVTLPSKTNYINDEAFSSEGMKLKATMNNGEARELSPSTPGVELGYESGAGFVAMPEGNPILKHRNEANTARYTYNGKTVSVPFSLTIADEVPVRLIRRGSFEGKAFLENLPFTPGEIGYTVELSNGKTLEIAYGNASTPAPAPGRPATTEEQGRTAQAAPAPDEKLVAGSNAAYGENTARFSFTMNGETVEDEFSYELQHRRVQSIEAVPTKQYEHGETIRPEDFRATLHWNNGETSTADPANVTVSHSEASNTSLAQATNAVTIGLRDVLAIGTPTISINITVKAPIPTSLQIVAPPTKTQYISGTRFDPAGLKLQAVYSNGAASEVLPGGAGLSIDTASELPFGAASVQTSYTHNGATVSTSIPITVIHETPTAIRVVSPPAKTSYVEGSTLDLTGLSIQATLSNGKTVTLPFNGAGVAWTPAHGAVLTTANNTVSLRYTLYGMTKAASLPITVAQKSIQFISVRTNPGKTAYTDGDAFNAAGLTLNCTYDNGTTGTISALGNMVFSPSILTNKTAYAQAQAVTVTLTGLRVIGSPGCTVNVTVNPGYVTCDRCNGRGKVTCSRCNGTGYTGGYEGTCSTCHITYILSTGGTIKCSDCGGSVSMSRQRCSVLKETCSVCQGKGLILAGMRSMSFANLQSGNAIHSATTGDAALADIVSYGAEDGAVTTSDSVTIPVDVYYALPDGETELENAAFFVRFSDGERVRADELPGVIEICYVDERLYLTYRNNGRWATRVYPRGLK